jgi:hypothetical protein
VRAALAWAGSGWGDRVHLPNRAGGPPALRVNLTSEFSGQEE